jgi:hypothetical protein
MKPILLLSFALGCSAETLVFHDGKTITGKLLGLDSQEVRLERCGHAEKYAREDLKSIALEESASAEPCTAASAPPMVELPSGTKIPLYLIDFIDSTTAPAGQVFRAEVEAPVKVGGQVAISARSRIILKLVDTGGSAEHPNLALDLVGIYLGAAWSHVEPVSGIHSVLNLKSTSNGDLALKEITLADFESKRMLLRGEHILVPSTSHITFVLNRAIRLLPEKR